MPSPSAAARRRRVADREMLGNRSARTTQLPSRVTVLRIASITCTIWS